MKDHGFMVWEDYSKSPYSLYDSLAPAIQDAKRRVEESAVGTKVYVYEIKKVGFAQAQRPPIEWVEEGAPR